MTQTIISRDEFLTTYTDELQNAIRDYPSDYHYPVDMAPGIALKMVDAIYRKTANKDSRAIKATCKRFGIKHTYTAIYAALGI